MIPTASLRIEYFATNPPKPDICTVIVEGKPIAYVTLDDLRAAAQRLEEMEAARRA